MKSLLSLVFVLFLGVTVHVAAEEIFIDFAHPQFAQLDAEGRRLLSEYAKAYPKIKHFYENIRMDAYVKDTMLTSHENLQKLRESLQSTELDESEIKDRLKQWEEGVQMERQYELRYRQVDRYARVDTKMDISVMDSVHANLSPGITLPGFVQEIEVVLFTPTMDYGLSKKDSSNPYFSLNVRRVPGKSDTEGVGLAVMYFDTAPFSLGTSGAVPLEKILFQRQIPKPHGLQYVRQRESKGEQVVEIGWSWSAEPDVFREIRLDRASWGIKESYWRAVATSPSDPAWREIRWYREACTYNGRVDGVPLLKTYQRSEGTYDKNTQKEEVLRQMLCEITNLIPGPPDLSEFDVAQFLPPDVKIGEITPVSFTPARIAAIVIGVILLLLGIYMHIRNSMRSST